MSRPPDDASFHTVADDVSPKTAGDDGDVLNVVEDVAENDAGDDAENDGPVDAAKSGSGERVWRILVVDDDEEVHASTAYSLRDVDVLGRRLVLFHAFSAGEALDLLRRDGDFAAVLLDVVMETPDAGLKLVKSIREELGLTAVRIILRTGQPGYAPELAVVRDYDVNDYRTKSETTRGRLLTSLYAALRAYGHIHALEVGRRGLERIVAASAGLFRRHSLSAFCEGVLLQLGGLLDIEISGFVLARTASPLRRAGLHGQGGQGLHPGLHTRDLHEGGDWGAADATQGGEPVILTAAGPFSPLSGAPLSDLADETARGLLRRALDRRANVFHDDATVLYIAGQSGDDLAIYVAAGRPLGPDVRRLLEVFCSNVALGFDNVSLLDDVRALAYYDPLTGLPNRALFLEEAARRLAAATNARNGDGPGATALALLDLDHFQAINDGLGHAVGDELLLAVARRLSGMFDEPGAVGRVASDMFGLLVRLNGSGERLERDVQEMIHAVEHCFSGPFVVAGHPIGIGVSGGFAVALDGEESAGGDVQLLVRRAGMALKGAKRGGRGRILRFDPTMEAELHRRVALVNRLQDAQAKGRFSLVYQPQLRLKDGVVFGAEALLRWRGEDGTMISPDLFIPAAEESGHIIRLGEWALREACMRQTRWRDGPTGRLRMAVNVSVRQLRDGKFVHAAERILAACGADPADVELEITESHAMETDRIIDAVRRLRDMGFNIAIDDFGTGYSSLARLQQVPASLLKIDRSFIADLDRRPESRSLTATIINIGRQFGMQTLAEGVENAAQEEILRDLGCDAAQGYLYAKPMTAEDFERWTSVRRNQAAP